MTWNKFPLSLCLSLVASLWLLAVVPLAQEPSAQFRAGLDLISQGRAAEAEQLWLSLADDGDVNATHALGFLYESGEPGVPADPAMAVLWYQRAADLGSSEAMSNLATLYAEGRGVEANPQKAVELWIEAARLGSAQAQYNLALIYFEGSRAVTASDENTPPENRQEAVRLLYSAALNGLPDAQFGLARLYLEGEGLPQSDAEALFWYRQAEFAGHPDAGEAASALEALGVTAPDQPRAELQPPLPGISSEAGEPIEFASDRIGGDELPEDVGTEAVSPVFPGQEKTPPTVIQALPSPSPPPNVTFEEMKPGSFLGLAYSAWLGSFDDADQAKDYWREVAVRQPDVLYEAPPFLETVRAGGKSLVRLHVGPFPARSIAWQVCNYIRSENPDLFCKAMRLK